MKKRLLSILLCCVMIICMMSGVAFADSKTPINSLKFTISGYELDSKALDISVTSDPGNAGITNVTREVLKNNHTAHIVDPNERLEAGMQYSLNVLFNVRDGYDIGALTADNVVIEGAEVTRVQKLHIASHPDDEWFLTIHLKPIDYLPVTDIIATVEAPKLGEEIKWEGQFSATGAQLVDPNLMIPVQWAKASIDNPDIEQSHFDPETFQPGYYYIVRVIFKPDKNYMVMPDTVGTLNGVSITVTPSAFDSNNGVLKLVFDPLEDENRFTIQPTGGTVSFGSTRQVTWETSFTPLKVELLRDGKCYSTLDDPTATTAFFSASPGPEQIRAYYGSGENDYVDSNAFYITYEDTSMAIPPLRYSLNGYGLGEPLADISLMPGADNGGVTETPYICMTGDQINRLASGEIPTWNDGWFIPDSDYYLVVRLIPEYGFDGSTLKKENITLEGVGAPEEIILRQFDGGMLGYAVFKLPQLRDPIVTIELPFTKTVRQGGTAAPGAETFHLEVFEIGNGNKNEYQDVSYTASVKTSGAGDYGGNLVITGPKSQVQQFISEGFFVREVTGSAANWTYSDAVWMIAPDYNGSSDEPKLTIYPTKMEKTDNGTFYVWDRENPADRMRFENVFTFDDPIVTIELPFTKTVKQGGTAAPGAETFNLEIFDIGNSNKNEYRDVSYTASVKTNGTGDYSGKLVITGPKSQVRQFISEGFFVREAKGSAANWTYSDAVWMISPDYNGSSDEPKLTIYPTKMEKTDNGTFYVWDRENPADRMRFENVFTFDDPIVTIELPFTKTVKQGGTAAPGVRTFSLEIFDIGNSNKNEYRDVSYTASVKTNGAGDYSGKLVITGPKSQVQQFISEGFFVREVKGSAANWTYSDAVWMIAPDYNDSRDEMKLTIYPTKMEKTDNGNRYVREGMNPVNKMSFVNTYTYSKTTAPKTGDSGNVLLWCVLLLTSAVSAGILTTSLRRKHFDN